MDHIKIMTNKTFSMEVAYLILPSLPTLTQGNYSKLVSYVLDSVLLMSK